MINDLGFALVLIVAMWHGTRAIPYDDHPFTRTHRIHLGTATILLVAAMILAIP